MSPFELLGKQTLLLIILTASLISAIIIKKNNNKISGRLQLSELNLPGDNNYYQSDDYRQKRTSSVPFPYLNSYVVSKKLTVIDNNVVNDVIQQPAEEQAPLIGVADICTQPELVQQFYWYCHFYYFNNKPNAMTLPDELFNTFSPYDAAVAPQVINYACGLPVTTTSSSILAAINWDVILQNGLCNNLILSAPSSSNYSYDVKSYASYIHEKVKQHTEMGKTNRKMKLYFEINTLPFDVSSWQDIQKYFEGIVLTWNSDLESLILTVEKFYDDAAELSSSSQHLSMALVLKNDFLQFYVQQPSTRGILKTILEMVDFVLIAPSDTSAIPMPTNKLFIDFLVASPQYLALSNKWFLPLELGAVLYNPPYAQALTASDACQLASTCETLQYSNSHSVFAKIGQNNTLTMETPCSLLDKLQLFRHEAQPEDVSQQQRFAGIYVPDITRDDMMGVCTGAGGAMPHALLRLVQRASVGPMEVANAVKQCAASNNYGWSTYVTI